MTSSHCSLINFHCSSSHTITLLQLLVLLLLLSSFALAQHPSDSSSTSTSTSTSTSDDGDPWAGNSNVSPSTAIVVIVLVIGFFITGCISIYFQQCIDTSSSSAATFATTGIINNNNVIRGLHQSVIDTFPEFQYSAVKELKIGKGALECAVCLSEFADDETLRLLPKCDHVFHSECIDTWLVHHTTCPVCRANLVVVVPDSGETPSNPPTESNSNSEVQITIPEHEETTSLAKNKGRLPRSHSTGHSLIQPGENKERFTLRLPAEVRRQLLARTKLKRATSLVALPRQSSSRRGYRGGGDGEGEGSGSSRYGRFIGRSIMLRIGSFRSKAKGEVAAPLDQTLHPPLDV